MLSRSRVPNFYDYMRKDEFMEIWPNQTHVPVSRLYTECSSIGGDESIRKNKSKIKNTIFLFETFFSWKFASNIMRVHVHLAMACLDEAPRIFEAQFLENQASNKKSLFFIFDLFLHVESPPPRLYYQYWNNQYSSVVVIYYTAQCDIALQEYFTVLHSIV